MKKAIVIILIAVICLVGGVKMYQNYEAEKHASELEEIKKDKDERIKKLDNRIAKAKAETFKSELELEVKKGLITKKKADQEYVDYLDSISP